MMSTAAAANQTDEQQIRDLIATWLRASALGDLPTVLNLMAEDVVFLIAGQPPMRGRNGFATAFEATKNQFRMEGNSEVKEIQVAGDLAYCWTQLTVTIFPFAGGAPKRRSGNTLTILRKNSDGNWVVFRDANMLAADN